MWIVSHKFKIDYSSKSYNLKIKLKGEEKRTKGSKQFFFFFLRRFKIVYRINNIYLKKCDVYFIQEIPH